MKLKVVRKVVSGSILVYRIDVTSSSVQSREVPLPAVSVWLPAVLSLKSTKVVSVVTGVAVRELLEPASD